LRVGSLLFCIEKALRLAWEDFVLEPRFTNHGGKEKICCIVIPRVRKRLFWLKLSGKYELGSLAKGHYKCIRKNLALVYSWNLHPLLCRFCSVSADSWVFESVCALVVGCVRACCCLVACVCWCFHYSVCVPIFTGRL